MSIIDGLVTAIVTIVGLIVALALAELDTRRMERKRRERMYRGRNRGL